VVCLYRNEAWRGSTSDKSKVIAGHSALALTSPQWT
jgi:hypothetical protein